MISAMQWVCVCVCVLCAHAICCGGGVGWWLEVLALLVCLRCSLHLWVVCWLWFTYREFCSCVFLLSVERWPLSLWLRRRTQWHHPDFCETVARGAGRCRGIFPQEFVWGENGDCESHEKLLYSHKLKYLRGRLKILTIMLYWSYNFYTRCNNCVTDVWLKLVSCFFPVMCQYVIKGVIYLSAWQSLLWQRMGGVVLAGLNSCCLQDSGVGSTVTATEEDAEELGLYKVPRILFFNLNVKIEVFINAWRKGAYLLYTTVCPSVECCYKTVWNGKEW